MPILMHQMQYAVGLYYRHIESCCSMAGFGRI